MATWVVASAGGLALGLANRAVYNLVVLESSHTYERFYSLLDWWFRRAWPAGLLAFAIGWFATSRKLAVGRAAVALMLSTLIPLSDLDDTGAFEVVGAVILGAIMGWAGFEGRGRRWTSVLLALAAPALMALDAVAHRPSDPPLSTGRWAVLGAAGALALVLVIRGAVVTQRDRRSARKPPADETVDLR